MIMNLLAFSSYRLNGVIGVILAFFIVVIVGGVGASMIDEDNPEIVRLIGFVIIAVDVMSPIFYAFVMTGH